MSNKRKEATLTVVGGTDNPWTQDEIEEKTKLSDGFSEMVGELAKKEVPFEDKMDILLQMQGKTVPLLVEELGSRDPDVDKSVIASRLGTFLKEMRETIIKKREVETSDEINPYSPKFQLIFEFFVELIHEVMLDQKMDEIEITNFFNAFAGEIAGWEEVVLKNVKGISSKALNKLSNPFIEKFKDQIKHAKLCEEAKEGMYYI